MTSRPKTLPGLVGRLLWLHVQRGLPQWALLAIVLAFVLLIFLLGRCTDPTTVATFNIENYPRDKAQIEGAFEAIEGLDADVIALQEITDTVGFASEAVLRLGPRWRAHFAAPSPRQKVGVLFNADRYDVLSTHTWTEVAAYPGGRPAFEIRLSEPGSQPLRIIVVHLKAMSDGLALRKRQYRALTPIVTRAMASGDRVVLLGDFNATGPEDRRLLETLAKDSGLFWATEKTECTAFWQRRTECLGSALDHALSWERPFRTEARGPCQTEGCEPRGTCPIFYKEVSDHCPITFEF